MHILHHVADGLKRYGPVHSMWMYPYERFNSWTCRRATNRRGPEATIIETYRVHSNIVLLYTFLLLEHMYVAC